MSLLERMVRLSERCPPAWKVTRAVAEPGREPEIMAHLDGCIRCAGHYQAHRDVVMRVRALPGAGGLSPESRVAIAANLWSAKPRSRMAPRRRRILLMAAIPLAAAIVLGIAAIRPPRPRERTAPDGAAASRSSLATIHSFGTARYARTQAAPDEIVRLYDGRITLDITPLHPSERFRVLTDDAVVEVRGTTFELTALAGRLIAASVTRGRVEVRAGNAFAVLDAGDRWERASPPVAAAPTPAAVPPSPPPAHTPARRPARPIQPRASTEVERAMFARGWAALRAGNAADAAVAFAELETRAGGSSIEEDALYWRAVAEARRHDEALAARLFQDFLKRFPGSGRRGEAATALGWLRLRANDVAGARSAFETAAGDPSPVVRSSAQEGLQRTK
jgi:hypothetical protein